MASYHQALTLLRSNKFIDYKQLGLKFRLFKCELLFNWCDVWRLARRFVARQLPLSPSTVSYFSSPTPTAHPPTLPNTIVPDPSQRLGLHGGRAHV